MIAPGCRARPPLGICWGWFGKAGRRGRKIGGGGEGGEGGALPVVVVGGEG